MLMLTLARVPVGRLALLTGDPETLGLSAADAAAEILGVPAEHVIVIEVDPTASGWDLVCFDRRAPHQEGGTNPVTVLHHLAAGRLPVRRRPPAGRSRDQGVQEAGWSSIGV